eukprot:TRINITY_DN23622_c0_g1_i1.p1 TRINITY_DN23622_c0_g1~~TRINITY_DN23622_c0_g1_i1.p1  ORF type:complete len:302 (-),score=42.50 TRINITY_DN23622_c0_g1_i1:63-968(-)
MQEATKAKILTTLLKPVTQLPVHTDLPRLVHVLTISKNQKLLFTAQLGVPALSNLENTLIVLTQELLGQEQKKIVSLITSLAEKHFLIGKDQPDKVINSILTEAFGIPGTPIDSNPVVKILKAMNQSVMAPALIELKMTLGIQNMTKDVAGSWKINVDFQEGANKEKTIVVTSLKREQHISNMFQYQWCLSFVFQATSPNSSDVQCKDVSVKVTDLVFSEDVCKKPGLKEEVKETLKKYITDQNILILAESKPWTQQAAPPPTPPKIITVRMPKISPVRDRSASQSGPTSPNVIAEKTPTT